MARPPGRRDFDILQHVRYRPGKSASHYKDYVEDDGQIAAVVVGYTPKRLLIQFGDDPIFLCVDAASLTVSSP